VTTIVGWDTATDDLVVAVTRNGEALSERALAPRDGARPRHAGELLAEVEAAAERAGGWRAIDAIAVGIGPGSFTGLRIGLATARAFTQALTLPVVPVGTLAALGEGIVERADDRPALAVLDARRGQVFAALYGPSGEEVWPPLVAAPDELAGRVRSLPTPVVAAGSGAVRFRPELEATGAEIPPESDSAHRVSGRDLCLLAEAGAPSPPDSIRPIYLRPPDAELWRERDAG
jgi:tRNA threonylcarbamoyladenosine biosynthesis protein TsaB